MRRLGPTALALLVLAGCHKRAAGGDPDATSSRGLQVEAYDPPIPKAPVKGRLETMSARPPTPAPAASTEAPAESSGAPGM
jgi:hypothetical protein